MNKEILIKGLEQGPPQKAFGDWSFRRFWRKPNASQIRLVHIGTQEDEGLAPKEPENPPRAKSEPA